jgi:hypothetical protein
MTVTMDIARLVTAASAFLSPDSRQDRTFLHMNNGEVYGNWVAWRTGTRLLRTGLAVQLTRQLKCRDARCYPSDTWFQPHCTGVRAYWSYPPSGPLRTGTQLFAISWPRARTLTCRGLIWVCQISQVTYIYSMCVNTHARTQTHTQTLARSLTVSAEVTCFVNVANSCVSTAV